MLYELVKQAFVIAVLSAIFVLLPQGMPPVKSVKAEERMIPFGGVIVVYVPPITAVCPAHTLIADFSTGIALPLGIIYDMQKSTLYRNFNYASTGTFVLGDYKQTDIVLCALPYPVVKFHSLGSS